MSITSVLSTEGCRLGWNMLPLTYWTINTSWSHPVGRYAGGMAGLARIGATPTPVRAAGRGAVPGTAANEGGARRGCGLPLLAARRSRNRNAGQQPGCPA